MVTIDKKITGQRIKKDTVVDVPVVQDECPLTKRIEGRPEGALEAISEKINYVGAEGRKKVYVIVSFMSVEGILDGKEVTIERPVEFFIPSGQLSSELQWVTASMRSLSLAARGGYVTQALQDLRKVAWDKGLVRCGMNKYGKPAFHDSEVAAIAWSIQQILYRRGFLDEDGLQVPAGDLVTTYARRHAGYDFENERASVDTSEESASEDDTTDHPPAYAQSLTNSVGLCPECSSDLVLMDGCPTCVEGCGWSKCG